jgi:RNA-directed DNA polymerase
MGLATPPKIQELQRKLGEKAKCEPEYRFYSLYDKVYRPDILEHAYRLAKANGGAPGVDGKTFEHIEGYGEKRFLEEVHRELKEETYRPEAVRRVMIPKPTGGKRPLGIPTIQDRTVQAAAKLVLEPIFEMDFTPNAHGYRPGHSAGQAVREVHELLKAGYTDVVDADLAKFFDTIPHSELLRSVARRVSDGRMLHLIKMWLKAPIEENNDRGKPTRRPSGSQGTPQGGVASPLLANIYMRRFLKAWEQRGHEQKLQARIVNYADDFVILCRRTAHQALSEARGILSRIGLTLNEAKTEVCDVWHTPFDFLGHTFRAMPSVFTGRPYLAVMPSKTRVARLKEKIRELTRPSTFRKPAEVIVGEVNAALNGWRRFFCYGTLRRAYRAVDQFVVGRLNRWLRRKHKQRGRGIKLYPPDYLYDTLSLMSLNRALSAARTPCR